MSEKEQTIAITGKYTEEEWAELASELEKQDVKLYPYKQASFDQPLEVIKVIFDGFSTDEFVRDYVLSKVLEESSKVTFNWFKKNRPHAKLVSWIILRFDKFVMNIHIQPGTKQWEKLKKYLTPKFVKNHKKGDIIDIFIDKDDNKIKEQVMSEDKIYRVELEKFKAN